MKVDASPARDLQYLVLSLSIASMLIPVFLLEYSILQQTGGRIAYPLDDTFIQMGIARNLALYGTWGCSPHEFASASSSLLYTVLLGGLFRIFPSQAIQLVLPLAVNLVAAIVMIIVLQKQLKKQGIRPAGQILILLSISWLTPLPTLIICGMEHTLQCLFFLLFIIHFADWIERMQQPATPGKILSWKLPPSVVLYGILTCTVRYEGLFPIGISCLILLHRKQIRPALRLGILSCPPLTVFGLYSMTRGAYFLPNSILVKSETRIQYMGLRTLLSEFLPSALFLTPSDSSATVTRYLLLILPLAYLFFRNKIAQSPSYGILLGLLTSVTFFQLALASTGWFYRYEAYLVCASVYTLGLLLLKYREDWMEKFRRHPWVLGFLGCMLLTPLGLRTAGALRKTVPACKNIYDQQYQMGLFCHRYYDRQTIVINDLGAVSYFGNSKPLDLVGLGSNEMTRINRRSPGAISSMDAVDSLCRSEKARIAIIYEQVIPKELHSRWKKIGSWQMSGNVICTEDSVSFYATEPGAEIELKKNLVDFEPSLPRDVTVRYTGQ